MTSKATYLLFAKVILLLVCLVSATRSFATHIVGGDMYYSYLGAAGYEITLTVYRDCGPDNVNQTPFDAFAQVGVYDNSTGNLYTSFDMDLSSAEVDWVPVELENPCFILPPDVCVERARYTETVDIPFNTAGYTLVYVRCCRNASIVNLDTPEDQGVSIVTTIPGTALIDVENNSAQFTNFPPVALCANAAFYFDASAADPDGDVLVYSFCDPLQGATPDDPAPPPPFSLDLNTVVWASGFSASYPVTSDPSLSIDPNTGQVTGTATEIGRYAIAICVSEYRNGELINTIMRDFQFNVTLCDPNIVASVPPQEEFCPGVPIDFENNSINASSYHWDFGVDGVSSDTSNVEFPTYTFPNAGEYTVTLVANPGWPCADTSQTIYSTYPSINPEILVEDFYCSNQLDYYSFLVTDDTEGNATYQWDFGPGSLPSEATGASVNNVQIDPNLLQSEVNVSIASNGCIETAQLTIDNPPDPIAIIEPQDEFCTGFVVNIGNASENGDTYTWEFGIPGNLDVSTAFSPTYNYPDTGVYLITLIVEAPFSCTDTAYSYLEVYGNLETSFPANDPQCFEGNSFDFQAIGASTPVAQYSWDFGPFASPQSSNSAAPQNISFSATGWQDVELTIAENGCVESYTDEVWVVANFENEFTVLPQISCPPLQVSFEANSLADVPVYYSWDFGDGGTSNSQDPNYIYENGGVFDVTVTAYTQVGCIESETVVFPQVIEVLMPPVAGFSIDPQILDILDPNVVVTDLSSGSISCYYTTSDGFEFEDCNFNYTFLGTGFQSITQIVTNDLGCTASITGEVIINGFLFFAPNAFTPNNDGLNDYWLPESTGVSSYDIKIFNRWGEVIFESDNPAMAWTGNVHNGEHFAQDGVYNYVVQAEDLVGLPHKFVGHIVLTR